MWSVDGGVDTTPTLSGGSTMGIKGELNSKHLGLKLEINKNLRLINTNLIDKLDS